MSAVFQTFSYSKEQVQKIYDYLDSNQDDVGKVFDLVWNEEAFADQRSYPPFLLDLIFRIRALRSRYVCGRDLKRIWRFMSESAQDDFQIIEQPT